MYQIIHIATCSLHNLSIISTSPIILSRHLLAIQLTNHLNKIPLFALTLIDYWINQLKQVIKGTGSKKMNQGNKRTGCGSVWVAQLSCDLVHHVLAELLWRNQSYQHWMSMYTNQQQCSPFSHSLQCDNTNCKGVGACWINCCLTSWIAWRWMWRSHW